ncbi:hypothetical protein OEZ86_005447 [Tetradesmus obliquus]|nr:hypothetical protein OEZ86_005447 [Tetradesmus obliquus]
MANAAPAELPSIEAVSDWDGSWYDVDLVRSAVVRQREHYGVKIVYQESEEEDFDVMWPHEFARRLRNSCQPVQDSECRKLQPGTRVVVLVKWPGRDEQKYYDAEIVSADFTEHGQDEGDCSCTFKVKYVYGHEPRAKQEGEFLAPVNSRVNIDDMCFPGGPALAHPVVLQWLRQISELSAAHPPQHPPQQQQQQQQQQGEAVAAAAGEGQKPPQQAQQLQEEGLAAGTAANGQQQQQSKAGLFTISSNDDEGSQQQQQQHADGSTAAAAACGNDELAGEMPDDLTDAQRRYFIENRQGKPTAWLKGEEHGFPKGWYIIERTRVAGASQGTKDRYYLPPDGRIVRSRGEAMARIGELERFRLLVDAAAEAWEHETQLPGGASDLQGAALLQHAGKVQSAVMMALNEHNTVAHAASLPLRLSDITRMAALHSDGTLRLLPSATSSLYATAAAHAASHMQEGRLTAEQATHLLASLAVLLEVPGNEDDARAVLAGVPGAGGTLAVATAGSSPGSMGGLLPPPAPGSLAAIMAGVRVLAS